MGALSQHPVRGRGGCDVPLPLADLVPKPTVNARAIRSDWGLCEATLECSVGLEGVTYEWIPSSKLSTAGENASTLLVSINPVMKTYTCKVSNPVSSNNASLTYQHPCSWTGTARGARAGRQNAGGMGCQAALEGPWDGGDPEDSGALQGWWRLMGQEERVPSPPALWAGGWQNRTWGGGWGVLWRGWAAQSPAHISGLLLPPGESSAASPCTSTSVLVALGHLLLLLLLLA